MLSGAVTTAAAPLDRARRALLLGLARVPALGAAVVRRDERLRLQALAGSLPVPFYRFTLILRQADTLIVQLTKFVLRFAISLVGRRANLP